MTLLLRKRPKPKRKETVRLGPESAGLYMTPEEFDGIRDYDECYHYELLHGVLVVSPLPLRQESSPNERLGDWLLQYQEEHAKGKVMDETLANQYVATSAGRRIADRVIWVGLGRYPRKDDLPKIAVEFVSGRKRDRDRDYVDKRAEYMEAKIREYWIVDRFERTMTVITSDAKGIHEKIVKKNQTYETPLLPGFKLPLARLLAAADRAKEE